MIYGAEIGLVWLPGRSNQRRTPYQVLIW